MTPRERRWLVAAVTASLAIRLALAAAAYAVGQDPAAFHVPDSARYLALGRELAERGTFSLDGQPELFRLPGFPLLVAGATAAGFPTAGTIVLHALIGAATTWICFLAGREVAGVRTGLWAAALHAIEPTQWASSSLVMTETLFAALVAGCFASAVRYLATMRPGWLIAATVTGAAAAYVRFIGYLLPAALLLPVSSILWRSPAGRDLGGLRRHVAAAAVVAVATLSTWHVRNGVETGYWGFSVQLERAAYFMGGGTVAARQTGASYIDTVRTMPGSGLAARATGEDAVSPPADVMRRDGLARMVEHPVLFASTYAAGIGTSLLHPGTATVMRPFGEIGRWDGTGPAAAQMVTLGRWDHARAILAQKGAAYWLLTVPLVLANLFYLTTFAMGARRNWHLPAVRLACALVAYFVIFSGGPDGDSRRRAPFMPIVCVVAATALATRRQPAADFSAAPGTIPRPLP